MSILQTLKSAIQPGAISQILHNIISGVHPTWTKEEADAAANSYVAYVQKNGQSLTNISLRDAFEAGAQWSKSLTQKNTGGVVTDVVKEIFGDTQVGSTVSTVVADTIQIVGDVAMGNTTKAAVDAVQDVLSLVAQPKPPVEPSVSQPVVEPEQPA